MRFMTLVKGPENFGQPPAELFEAINALGAEAAAAGVTVESGGLLPSAAATRVRVDGGKVTVSDGPFTETKEVVGGFAFYEVESRDEAVAWANKFMQAHVEHWPGWEGETEVRQVMDFS